MPRKPKMGERIEALEEQMGEVKTNLQALALQECNNCSTNAAIELGGDACEVSSSEHGRCHRSLVQFVDGDGGSINLEEFVEAFELLSSQVGQLLEMMRMARDVEEELKEEDDDGNRAYGKKPLGRNESSGPGSIFRSGFNPA
ncbi:hypothetical protein L195_g011683 [Trifolium pratense]|uniref:Uncharacterized protein n=1 Tax=Trifolium pratense TaxID=57577 RepID=A0A2K3PI73_TRIPR|nr:hypothetical protein L195_g011683 [Trifolium pratense]